MRVLLAFTILIGMSMTAPFSVAGPLDPVEDLVCGLQNVLPCGSGQVKWWSETPGVGWGEQPSVSEISADRQTVYTAATVNDGTGGGEGCFVYATDTTTGVQRWSTIIPQHTGCGIVFDLKLEPVTGDLLIAGLDWRGSDVAGLHRISQVTGTILWQYSEPERVFSAVAMDPNDNVVYVAGWTEETHQQPQAFVQSIDLLTGIAGDPSPAMPDGDDLFWALDVVRDAERDLLIIAGAAAPEPDDPFEDPVLAATLHATDATGNALWTARDPTEGSSFGAQMDYSAGKERAFMATQNGLLTVDAADGTVLGLAVLDDGGGWDDLWAFYGVAYDEAQDLAVMTGSRAPLPEQYGAAYAMVAARGEDGAEVWDTDVALAATEGIVIPAAPMFDEDGRPWFAGGATTTIGFQAIVGTVDPANGNVIQRFYAEHLPGDQSGAHHVGVVDAESAVISGGVFRDDTVAAFEALVSFDLVPLDE